MLLSPKRVKWRKPNKNNKHKGVATRGTKLAFGEMGIKAMQSCRLTNRVIEACRVTLNRTMKRGGKVWIRIYPHKSVTSKPAEVRQGKGKGAPDHWVAEVKAGMVLFEITHSDEEVAKKALSLCAYKLPIKTKIMKREY